MGRKRTRLILSEFEREELRRQLRQVRDERDKERLSLVMLSASGKHTVADLARLSGRVPATIQNWLKKFRAGGIAGILERETPPGAVSPIASPMVQAELRTGVATGRWQSASEVARWLKDEHGIKRATKSIYYWLSKTAMSQ